MLDLLVSVHWTSMQPMYASDRTFFFVSFSSSVKSVALTTHISQITTLMFPSSASDR